MEDGGWRMERRKSAEQRSRSPGARLCEPQHVLTPGGLEFSRRLRLRARCGSQSRAAETLRIEDRRWRMEECCPGVRPSISCWVARKPESQRDSGPKPRVARNEL